MYIKLFALLSATVFMLASCDHSQHSDDGHDHEADTAQHEHDAEEIVFTPEQARAASLATETVQPGDFTAAVRVSGSILPTPNGEVTIAATMAGIVSLASGDLTVGHAVSRGQSLFSVSAATMADGDPNAAAVAELSAALSDYRRAEALAKEQIISARELEQARQRYETAVAASRSLGHTRQRTVCSTMSGYVKTVIVKPGDYVEMGQPLAVITKNRRLQLRAEVPERLYAHLPYISSANFRLATDAPQTIRRLADLNGRLIARGSAAEDGSSFVPVIFEFDNVGDLVSGSMADIFLLATQRQDVISVPVRSLTEQQGQYYVYVKTSDHTYRQVGVDIGDSNGARVEIKHGLKAGDLVVVNGAVQVKLAAVGTAVPEGHKH